MEYYTSLGDCIAALTLKSQSCAGILQENDECTTGKKGSWLV
ncbi:hypothetical protein BH09BAC4_BH09BAC4_29540 [soil metagenome]